MQQGQRTHALAAVDLKTKRISLKLINTKSIKILFIWLAYVVSTVWAFILR